MDNGKKLSDVIGAVYGAEVEDLLAAGDVHPPVFHCTGISAACGIYGKTVFEDCGRVGSICVVGLSGFSAAGGCVTLDVVVR